MKNIERICMKDGESIYSACRKRAAIYNEKLNSRERAAELLGISTSTLSNHELGVTKNVPPDTVVMMADLYVAPELKRYYCKNECPIGRNMPVATEESGLQGITVKILNSLDDDSMDDVIILHQSKAQLREWEDQISGFLESELELQLNKKTCIRPINQGIEFVGYRVWPDRVVLRKSTTLHIKRTLRVKREAYRIKEATFREASDTLMAYLGMMKHCDCDALRAKILEDFVLTHGSIQERGDIDVNDEAENNREAVGSDLRPALLY